MRIAPLFARTWPLVPSALVCALLAACGGGSESTATSMAAQAFEQAPLARSARALGVGGTSGSSAADTAITNEQLFAWAQQTYPDLFGTATPQTLTINYQGKTFDVRFFAAKGTYLGVANGEAFGLGAFTGNALQSFGAVQQYASLVCAKLGCGSSTGGGTPGGGTPGGGTTTGSLNECIDPNGLATGNKLSVTYTYSGIITGDQTVEVVVNGSATFEGQSAIQTTNTTRGSNTIQGFTVPITTVSKAYLQNATGGFTKTLGTVVDATTGGISIGGFGTPDTTISTKAVFDPAELNSEFGLSLGQSVTKTTTIRSTILASSMGVPAPGTTSTASSTVTHTFEAKESVTVPAGTYSTCRYKVTGSTGEATTNWFILGKGIMAKSEVRTTAGTQVIQLKSGTFNGSKI